MPPAVAPSPTYPAGHWVYSNAYGWLWVPDGSSSVEVEGEPYVYLYTPSFGWTWYVSPWGWGPFFYGPWVYHPWHARGWGGPWVAPPHVAGHLGHRR
jgi:hypothetical protein